MSSILFVSHTSDISGPTYRLLKVVRALREPYRIAVVAPGGGQLFDELEELSVEGYRIGQGGLTRRIIPWLYGLITREGFDLVYGNNYSSGPRNGLIAAKLARKPFVWHINEMLRPNRAGQRRKTAFLRYADVIIADSQACAETVRHHTNKPVHQIYNGIGLADFVFDQNEARGHVRQVLNVPQEHLVVVNAGIVCQRKGQWFSLEAAVEILKDYENVTFVFLGSLDVEPAYASMLLTEVERMGLGDRVQFLGFREDFPRFLVGSDIVLHTAVSDPHPIVVLGAMAAGRPVVAFGVDGLKEQVVHGETGFLSKRHDVEAIVRALRSCLDDPTLRNRMGERGRQRAEERFSVEIMVKSIDELLRSLLTDGSVP